MDSFINYIIEKYNPLTIIVYGSYADGSNNAGSDFDALVISAEHEKFHDTSFVDGVHLDVFVYPASCIDGAYDCNEFVQLFDGIVVMDTDNIGTDLKNTVLEYLESIPQKSQADIKADLDWCAKMLERVKRNDAEGMYRWHWLLVDSLEIFCDVLHHRYYGPKKTLKWMEQNYPEAFECYNNALYEFTLDSLNSWIAYLNDISCGE